MKGIQLIILTCAFAVSAPVDAHPELHFQVSSHIEPAQNQKAAPSDETYPMAVTLGHSYLVTEFKGKKAIYDFERNRIVLIDLQRKSYEDYSLYSNVGFRVLEFYNRRMLSNMLQAAKLQAPHSEPALLEQLFSLTDDKVNTVIETSSSNGHTVFEWQNHLLATIAGKAEPLPDDYRSEFWRFVRYFIGGHPKILSELSSFPGVPVEIAFVLTDFKTETRTLTLQSMSTRPDVDYSLAGYVRKMPDAEPYRTLATIGERPQDQVKARAASALKDRDVAFAKGDYLESVLANLEAALSTGEADPTWLASMRQVLMSDPKVSRLFGSISPQDEAGAQRAATQLAELRALHPAHSDVIDVFEGNIQVKLKKGPDGAELLLAALHQNPYFTGAWHDLGDFYYRSFRMQEAWACLDAARAMRPNDSMLHTFDQLEKELRTRNPEYF